MKARKAVTNLQLQINPKVKRKAFGMLIATEKITDLSAERSNKIVKVSVRPHMKRTKPIS